MLTRTFLAALSAVAALLFSLMATPVMAEDSLPLVSVYKSPSCGCCGSWIKHLEESGFKVEAHNRDNMNPIKRQAGLTPAIASCHTAFVDGYVVEGHVPANDIKRMLTERPDIKGISVPGMPVGSPGMEMGDRVDAYDVVSFDDKGNTKVFHSYP
ncbi:DUF411 domain-containing protein [Aestuariirhabdus sp. Z084]|uniref:DUF411 domain-containing protein n=1 Tax=Aestuariirhabdus haliotis TaxID=2918751 RepID=UPI00201B37C9|nr:DUF411 domain-containing protein [Aestuariirhabdus haliotis]MCL6417645.1 DUF411 domain-containing protein [Aestuariirhabdus haliotis]MCL6421571.1 DUF411 domain-containing protein [Aestuariirhabdus haliotis]